VQQVTGDSLQVRDTAAGSSATATGTIAGVSAAVVLQAAWSDFASTSGVPGPPLQPVRTRAQATPYLPTVRGGKLTADSSLGASWQGQLAGRAPLVSIGADIQLLTGGTLRGPTKGVMVGVEGRQCSTRQAWADCAPVDAVQVDAEQNAQFWLQPTGQLQLRVPAAVTESLPDGGTTQLGTLDLRLDVAPSEAGEPWRAGNLSRSGQYWDVSSWLRYPLAGAVTLAGRPVPTSGDLASNYETFWASRRGTL
jgi:hypothetical protein